MQMVNIKDTHMKQSNVEKLAEIKIRLNIGQGWFYILIGTDFTGFLFWNLT